MVNLSQSTRLTFLWSRITSLFEYLWILWMFSWLDKYLTISTFIISRNYKLLWTDNDKLESSATPLRSTQNTNLSRTRLFSGKYQREQRNCFSYSRNSLEQRDPCMSFLNQFQLQNLPSNLDLEVNALFKNWKRFFLMNCCLSLNLLTINSGLISVS